jgi:hypothetical protein
MFDGWCIRPPKNNTSTLIELRSTQSIIDGQGMGWSGSHDDVCMCVQQTSGQHWNKKQKVLPGSVRFFSFQHFYLFINLGNFISIVPIHITWFPPLSVHLFSLHTSPVVIDSPVLFLFKFFSWEIKQQKPPARPSLLHAQISRQI